jgi:hypothetical protein
MVRDPPIPKSVQSLRMKDFRFGLPVLSVWRAAGWAIFREVLFVNQCEVALRAEVLKDERRGR